MEIKQRQRRYQNIWMVTIILAITIALLSAIWPVEIGLIIGYIVLGLAALSAIIFPVISLVRHPRESIRPVIGIMILGVVFFICWLIANGEPIMGLEDGTLTVLAEGSLSRMAGAGIWFALTMIVITIIAFIAAEVEAMIT